MDKVAVIVLHYKNESDTLECLLTLLNNSHKILYEIIVVANQSSGKFIRASVNHYPKMFVLPTNTNVGFAEGINIGLKKAMELKCNYMILLNNDVLVGEGLVDKMIRYAKGDPSSGIISPKIYFASGFEYHSGRYKSREKGKIIWYAGGFVDWANIYATHRGVDEFDQGQYDKTEESEFATGCCMLIKKEVIDKIGFFDNNYFLYYEDVDYSVRAKNIGYKIIYYPKAFLWHKNASSSEKPGSSIHIYYQTRNRLYFGYKYASIRTKKSLLFDSIGLFLNGGIPRKAVVDYYLGRMGRGTLCS